MHTYKSYVTGFAISLILTFSAYFVVVLQVPSALIIILLFAILQFFVQLFFFLHVNQGLDKGWNIAALISTVSTILILVVGSLWIMNHLNYNMTSSEMNAEIMKAENIKK